MLMIFSSLVSSVRGYRVMVSPAVFSFPGMCRISKSNSCRANVQRMSLPFVSRHCFRNVSAWWSVKTIVWCPMRDCLNFAQQYTKASATISVVVYRFFYFSCLLNLLLLVFHWPIFGITLLQWPRLMYPYLIIMVF